MKYFKLVEYNNVASFHERGNRNVNCTYVVFFQTITNTKLINL